MNTQLFFDVGYWKGSDDPSMERMRSPHSNCLFAWKTILILYHSLSKIKSSSHMNPVLNWIHMASFPKKGKQFNGRELITLGRELGSAWIDYNKGESACDEVAVIGWSLLLKNGLHQPLADGGMEVETMWITASGAVLAGRWLGQEAKESGMVAVEVDRLDAARRAG